MTGEDRRRWDRSYGGSDAYEGGGAGWDEVRSRDPGYDPQGRSQTGYWEGGAGGPRGDPHGQPYSELRYSYYPPPPAYAQYPPPAYAHPYAYPAPYARNNNPGLAVVAGVLTLITGALGVLVFALMLGDDSLFWLPALGWCAVAGLIMSFIAVLGGIVAIMKRMFPLAVLGAICAMIALAFTGFGFMMGLLALILLVISKDAFQPMSRPAQLY